MLLNVRCPEKINDFFHVIHYCFTNPGQNKVYLIVLWNSMFSDNMKCTFFFRMRKLILLSRPYVTPFSSLPIGFCLRINMALQGKGQNTRAVPTTASKLFLWKHLVDLIQTRKCLYIPEVLI